MTGSGVSTGTISLFTAVFGSAGVAAVDCKGDTELVSGFTADVAVAACLDSALAFNSFVTEFAALPMF